MSVKEYIKKIKEEWKKNSERNKEIDRIKREAYYEAMKEQASKMGKKQAELDANHREILYSKKLKEMRKKKEKSMEDKGQVDMFELNKNKEINNSNYNWITGKYIG